MRCYLHLVNGYDTILDDDGIEVSDFEPAKDQALTNINELKRLLGGHRQVNAAVTTWSHT